MGLLSQLGNVLTRIVGFGAHGRSQKHAARQRPAAGARNEADFLEQLKGILAHNADTVQAGRVTILGLDRLKSKLGARWDGLRERVHSLARSAFAKCLGADDIWLPLGDSYVIAFGGMEVEDAQTKCRMIGRMIEEALLGEKATDGIAVAAAVATFNGKVFFRELPPLEAMLSTLPSFSTSWPQREQSRSAAPSAAPAVERIRARLPKPVTPDKVPSGDAPHGVLVWEPIWDVRHERVPLYRARYRPQATDDGTVGGGDESAIGREDIAVRDMVLGELTRSTAEARLIVLGLPVRFWTIASFSRRREYLTALLTKTSPEMRKYLVIFLSSVPPGVPGSRLLELIAALKPLCRELVVETDLRASDLGALASSKVYAVGADLSAATDSEELLMLQMDQFARQAVKAGASNCSLSGVKTVSAAIAAVGAGFRYIGGSVIGSLDQNVSKVRPLTLFELYRRSFESQDATWSKEEGAEIRRSA